MWTRPARAGVAASVLLAAGLATAPAALAQADPQIVEVVTDKTVCGQVTVTLINRDTGGYGFNLNLVPFDGVADPLPSVLVRVAAKQTVTRTVEFPEDSFGGQGAFALSVAFGPNAPKQPVVDLGLIDTDCEDTPPATTTAAPTSTVAPTATVAPTLAPAPTTSTSATTPPPLPGDDVDCNEVTPAEAQAILDANPADPNGLDADDDGIACDGVEDGDFDQVGAPPRGGVATGA